jgi:hypothetical protein
MGSREVAQIGGPGLGGLLAQAAGPVTGLLADAVSFAVSFCCLTAMQPPRDRRSGGPAAGGVLDGLRFAWRDPGTLIVPALSALEDRTAGAPCPGSAGTTRASGAVRSSHDLAQSRQRGRVGRC